ncbi:peptidyl-tRNA hydrolase [Corynebacterium epidermidicanis]|uniref:peptidyl-tRNA hydrolase n=1 Tax=Corynebacterium epidermidicanis TaxID=1050174 RepID=A0A0G3GWG5_9CORY|nr:peptidyl-tRNA hydrolase [Corynebacterium epidermidicanis]AKK03868.1 hypothetical protein CEPID_10145 [Corynebacterium epidermidicanis]
MPVIDPSTDSPALGIDLAALRISHERLRAVLDPDRDGEDPNNPATVQAMPIVLHMPKNQQIDRLELLEVAARAVVKACLDERAAGDTEYAAALQRWYGARIRKIARRARNTAWERVQQVPGVTVSQGNASARACIPSPVQDTDPLVTKLQIGGTDLDASPQRPIHPGIALIAVDAGLRMSVGKAAAQVGHGSMLLAAHSTREWVSAWGSAGFPLQVREISSPEFRRLAQRSDAVAVQDAGYTEVAPGSVTVVALAQP